MPDVDDCGLDFVVVVVFPDAFEGEAVEPLTVLLLSGLLDSVDFAGEDALEEALFSAG